MADASCWSRGAAIEARNISDIAVICWSVSWLWRMSSIRAASALAARALEAAIALCTDLA
jgi:hypothetical protein